MSALDDLIARNKPSALTLFAWAIVLLLTVALLWASQARLDEVATAFGEVIPVGQVKTIQHLEGGIIAEMFVTEGSLVTTGSPLVRLDLTESDTREAELSVTLDGLVLRRARLDAEAHDTELSFPQEVAERRPASAQNERNAFNARIAEQRSVLNSLEEQIKQRESDLRQMQAEEATLREQLALAQQNLEIANDLIVDGLISKLDHLAAQSEVERLSGQLSSTREGLPSAESALVEARERLNETHLAFQRNALEELSSVDLAIETTREELTRATAVSRRTLIASPIDGVVKSLRFHTIGAVVRPGEAIMDIVPTDEQLVIEARLNPQDVGYVRVGQPAVVKISTYDYIRYGVLEATVMLVSPDSHQDENGNTYFRVIAATDRTYMGQEPGDLPITSGMEATLDIHTGTNTVMHYLLKPVLKLKSEAFRER